MESLGSKGRKQLFELMSDVDDMRKWLNSDSNEREKLTREKNVFKVYGSIGDERLLKILRTAEDKLSKMPEVLRTDK